MVRRTSMMMITLVDRAQQGQNVNILRATEMISERERQTDRQIERKTDGSQLAN